MAIVQNTYTGNGSTTLYSLSFPYLDATDVKVTLNGAATTAYVFVNASTIQFITAPAAGVAIRIYRETDIESQTATFFAGSAIRAQDLNDNLTQTLYAVQESNFEADTATSTANTALTNSNTAISTANTASTNASNAVTTANTASANASAAVSTANTANTNASNAVTTANTASSNASAAVTTANTALSTANSATTTANSATTTANSALTAANNAVSTANTASSNATTAVNTANTANSNATTALTTANSALSTANTALTNSSTAITTANSAIAAVASAVIYTPVANLTALAALTPVNGDYFELTDSTGAESSALITGVTVGLVGAPGLTFRLRYDSPPGIYTFLGYFANDSETRYLKFSGGTLTGQLRGDDSTSAATPGFAFDGDSNTGVGRPGADELALITGGSTRLTIDSAGAVAIPGTLGVTGNVSGGALIPSASTVPTNGVYLPSANNVAISTNGSQRLLINSSGQVSTGAGISSAGGLNVSGGGWGVLPYVANSLVADSTAGQTRLFATGTDASTHGNLLFFTGTTNGTASERMRLDSSGRLGLGTTSVSGKLDVAGSAGTFSVATDGATVNFTRAGANYIQAAETGATLTYRSGEHIFTGSSLANERMRIDSSGRVGIGTSTFDSVASGRQIVEINGTSTTLLNLDTGGTRRAYIFTDGTDTYLYNTQAGSLILGSNNGEAARIDSNKRFLVGTSSARSNFFNGANAAQMQVEGTTLAATTTAVIRSSADAFGPVRVFAKSRNASVGGNTIVSSGDECGTLDFQGNDGTEFVSLASIVGVVDGTPGANDMPGRLVFSTTADGASSPTERMRIANNGAISTVVPGGSTLYPAYDCRAWVNFNGTGTVAIRASGNVSSITDNAIGDYTVNFTSVLTDANYSVGGSSGGQNSTANGAIYQYDQLTAKTASICRVAVLNSAGGTVDAPQIAVQIFR